MKKGLLTSLWILLLLIWFGIYKFVGYQIDMYYSNLAPQQFEDDSAYAKLQTHGTVDNIALLVLLLGVGFCVYRIVKIWSKQTLTTADKP